MGHSKARADSGVAKKLSVRLHVEFYKLLDDKLPALRLERIKKASNSRRLEQMFQLLKFTKIALDLSQDEEG
jgi:hypothetical protein